MPLRTSTAAKNAVLDTGFDAVFNGGVLEIRSGAQPASANDAAAGTLLASIPLPADAFAAAVNGLKSKSGTWQDPAGDAAGVAAWFRIKQSDDAGSTNGTDERVDGDVTLTGAGGALTLDNTNIAVGQVVNITSFTVGLAA